MKNCGKTFPAADVAARVDVCKRPRGMFALSGGTNNSGAFKKRFSISLNAQILVIFIGLAGQCHSECECEYECEYSSECASGAVSVFA